jgi:hypothetical protein
MLEKVEDYQIFLFAEKFPLPQRLWIEDNECFDWANLWYIVSVPNASSKQQPSHRRQNSFVIVGSRSWIRPSLDWLLVFVPIAIVIRFVQQLHSPTALFIVSCLAVIPLAAWMGRSTEHLAKHLGSGIGSLLNATFGNAAELIIALFALARGLEGVVKASITGSIIGNLLLVLGFSFFSGGIKFTKQEFNRTVVLAIASLIVMPLLARAKRKVARGIKRGALMADSKQTEL